MKMNIQKIAGKLKKIALSRLPSRPRITKNMSRILIALAIASLGYAIVLLFPHYRRVAIFGFVLEVAGLIPIVIFSLSVGAMQTLRLIPIRKGRRG